MIHPDTELRFVNEIIGHGVFATKLIPKGAITWVRDDLDQSFSPEEFAAMAEPYRGIVEKYSFVDASGQYVLCWDHSRFFNHSCDANCLSAGYDFEVAIRDIKAGDQLTDDYGSLNLRESFACRCGSPRCRGRITAEDMEGHAEFWDSLVLPVFGLIPQVPQPLWGLVKEKSGIESALKNPTALRSIRCNYSKAKHGTTI